MKRVSALAVAALAAGGAIACSGKAFDPALLAPGEPTGGAVVGTAAGHAGDPEDETADERRGGDVSEEEPRADASVPPGPGDGGAADAGDAAIERDASTKDAGKGSFGDPCKDGAGCASGVCFTQGSGAGYCSVRCTLASGPQACPATSLGCNAKGYCRKP